MEQFYRESKLPKSSELKLTPEIFSPGWFLRFSNIFLDTFYYCHFEKKEIRLLFLGKNTKLQDEMNSRILNTTRRYETTALSFSTQRSSDLFRGVCSEPDTARIEHECTFF